MDLVPYHHFGRCYRLTNDVIDLLVTADIGPRIIRFGFGGDRNEFAEFDLVEGEGGSGWQPYRSDTTKASWFTISLPGMKNDHCRC